MLFRPTAISPRKVVGSLVGASFMLIPGREMPPRVVRAMPRVKKSSPTLTPSLLLADISSARAVTWSFSPFDWVTFSRARALMNSQGMFSLLTVLSFRMYSSFRVRAPRLATPRWSSWSSSRGTVI